MSSDLEIIYDVAGSKGDRVKPLNATWYKKLLQRDGSERDKNKIELLQIRNKSIDRVIENLCLVDNCSNCVRLKRKKMVKVGLRN